MCVMHHALVDACQLDSCQLGSIGGNPVAGALPATQHHVQGTHGGRTGGGGTQHLVTEQCQLRAGVGEELHFTVTNAAFRTDE